MKKHNFGSGPGILPQHVIQKASQALIELNGTGLSLIETSHHSQQFGTIMEQACTLALEHLDLQGKGYTALWLQGGASTQFLMVAYNLLQKKAGYINTGIWSIKAIKEARLLGQVVEIASSQQQHFRNIPKAYTIPNDLDYLHLTSNNTAYGTQIKQFPKTDVPLVCDMSSDIFSRQLNFSQFQLIYAGAQNNIGPAGTTLVILKEDLLDNVSRKIPAILNYNVHLSKNSIFNTPPVFAIYVSLLNLQWLRNLGGIQAIEKTNQKKAELIYTEIDRNPLFLGRAATEDRSLINATFTLTEKRLTDKFNALCQQANISGLSGHSTVGGYRASLYNALPLKSVAVLIEAMRELEKRA